MMDEGGRFVERRQTRHAEPGGAAMISATQDSTTLRSCPPPSMRTMPGLTSVFGTAADVGEHLGSIDERLPSTMLKA